MANMNWELIKERNGCKKVTLPDLKEGDVILFDGEADDAQGHIVTDIYQWSGAETVSVQHMPEHTPVCNESMFKYGKTNFRHKYKK